MKHYVLALAAILAASGASGGECAPPSAQYVATNNALRALPSFQALDGVWRTGFAAAGDAPALYYVPSTSACALGAGSGDNGSQVASQDGKCWIAQFQANGADARQWGVKADGSTDNAIALQAALNVIGKPGVFAELQLPPGVIATSTLLTLGDGTNTSVASIAGVRIHGYGAVSSGQFGAPQQGTVIKYTGGVTAAPVLKVNGPIHNVDLDHIGIDAGSKAAGCLEVVHPYASKFDFLDCVNWTGTSFNFHSIVGALFSGMQMPASENYIGHLRSVNAGAANASGMRFAGDSTHSQGFSRNTIDSVYSEIAGGSTASCGITLDFIDQNIFIRPFTVFGTAGTSGHTVCLLNGPWETVFIGADLIGQAITGNASAQGIQFYGYSIDDGEIVPDPTCTQLIHTITFDGQMHCFPGSPVVFTGSVDGSGLGGAAAYLAASGTTSATSGASTSNREFVNTTYVCNSFAASVDSAPGGTATRTIALSISGTDNPTYTLTWNPSDNGFKSVTTNINMFGPVFFNIHSSMTGAPSNTLAEWSLKCQEAARP